MKPSKPTVTFSDSSPQGEDAKTRARAAVARAKGQNQGRPKAPNLNQRFDQPMEEPVAGTTLRPETQKGLEAMMEEAKRSAEAKARGASEEAATPMEVPPSKLLRFAERLIQRRSEVYDEELEASVKQVAKDLNLPEPMSKEDAERAEWEKTVKLEPLEIDAYILNGTLQQSIPVLGDKLSVTFRTTVEGTEAFIETRVREFRKEAGGQMMMSEFYRHQARLALACQIVSFGPKKWPTLLDANGEVDPKAFDLRVSLVKQIPAQIFPKVAQHLGWFNARVDALLRTPEVLGNG